MDKTTRMHMASPIFESGKVWYPAAQKFADEVIEEVASFPNGDHDDFCDSMTMALMRFRQGGFISLQGEELEDCSPAEKIIDGTTTSPRIRLVPNRFQKSCFLKSGPCRRGWRNG